MMTCNYVVVCLAVIWVSRAHAARRGLRNAESQRPCVETNDSLFLSYFDAALLSFTAVVPACSRSCSAWVCACGVARCWASSSRSAPMQSEGDARAQQEVTPV
jgi:hypothetical protein